MRVLVAEDVEDLAAAIAAGLRREGMVVDIVLDGTAALDHVAVTRYDVVVLDRDLPGTHGDEVCRRLTAERSQSRVLMLTAASTVRERVDGLGLGADDYLPKPFDFAELVARIRALGRRPETSLPPVLEHGEVTLDPSRRIAFRQAGASTSAPRNSRCWSTCSPRPAGWSPPRNCSSESGTRPPTPSPPRSSRPCAGSGSSSVTRPSSALSVRVATR